MEAKEGARSRGAAAAVIPADGDGDYSGPGWPSGDNSSGGEKGACWTIDEVEVRVRVYLFWIVGLGSVDLSPFDSILTTTILSHH